MSSRSERYLANAEKCQRCADVAYTSGTKRLYGVLASNWQQLAEEADSKDKIGSRRPRSTFSYQSLRCFQGWFSGFMSATCPQEAPARSAEQRLGQRRL